MNSLTNQSVYLVSLGCPKNLADSQVIAGNLLTNGASWAYSPDEATLYVINTCAFLPEARGEASDEIAIAVDWKKQSPEERKIIVCGCLSQYDKDGGYRRAFPDVDIWAGVDDIAAIDQLLLGCRDVSRSTNYLCSSDTPQLQLTMPHVAYLKIADGCNNICSYCAIPSLRGSLRSRSVEDVLCEAENLIANGVSELIIVAQDITAFGRDNPEHGESLPVLLKAIDALEGDFGIRLLYTHPAHYTPELFDTLSTMKHLIPYVDIPLQHINDRILKAMNRHVDRARITGVIASLREAVPGITLRTTFITGFPGETENEFAELADFIKEMKFERLGVFPYSPEPGTKAAAMPEQIPLEIAEKRAAKIMSCQRRMMKKANAALNGTLMQLTVDYVEEGIAVARGAGDAPDIDNVIFVDIGRAKIRQGDRITAEITGTKDCDLLGVLKKGKKR